MTLRLNSGTFGASQSPANVEVFTDRGSGAHFLLGMVAGSDWLTAKDAVILFGAFTGYQLSQAGGESFDRIGGELIEFILGMLTVRLLPLLGVR